MLANIMNATGKHRVRKTSQMDDFREDFEFISLRKWLIIMKNRRLAQPQFG